MCIVFIDLIIFIASYKKLDYITIYLAQNLIGVERILARYITTSALNSNNSYRAIRLVSVGLVGLQQYHQRPRAPIHFPRLAIRQHFVTLHEPAS